MEAMMPGMPKNCRRPLISYGLGGKLSFNPVLDCKVFSLSFHTLFHDSPTPNLAVTISK